MRAWSKAGLSGALDVMRDGEELVKGLDAVSLGAAQRPCLVVLDSVVKPLSTTEICAAIDKLPKHIPIVLLSGAQDSPLQRSLCRSRLVRSLSKPINADTLKEVVRENCPELM